MYKYATQITQIAHRYLEENLKPVDIFSVMRSSIIQDNDFGLIPSTYKFTPGVNLKSVRNSIFRERIQYAISGQWWRYPRTQHYAVSRLRF